MSIIKSKYRKLFLTKICTFSIVSIACLFLCFYNSINSDAEIYDHVLFQVGIAVLVLSFIGLGSILTLYRLVVTEKEITKIAIISRKKTVIRFNEIKTIESFINKSQGPVTVINDGYFAKVITSDSGKVIVISPNEFENSDKIINYILENRHNHL